MFRTIPLSIIRSFSLYTQQRYVMQVPSWSCSQAVSKPVWHIQLLCVQLKTPDDGQRSCLKHVEFYSKNKFEKLEGLVVFIIRIYHDARSPERQRRNSNSVWEQLLLGKFAILAKIAYELSHVCPPSVRLSECISSAPTGQISVRSDFHYTLSIKSKSDKNIT